MHPTLAGRCPLLNSAVESEDAFPEIRQRVSRAIRAWHEQIQKHVAEGKQNGEFGSKVSPQAAAAATVITSSLEEAFS